MHHDVSLLSGSCERRHHDAGTTQAGQQKGSGGRLTRESTRSKTSVILRLTIPLRLTPRGSIPSTRGLIHLPRRKTSGY